MDTVYWLPRQHQPAGCKCRCMACSPSRNTEGHCWPGCAAV